MSNGASPASTFRERLTKAADPVIGCFARLPCVEAVEILVFAGFDFVVVDREHSPIDDTLLANMVRAGEAAGDTPVLARMPDATSLVGHALDSGAAGVHIPRVQHADEVEAVVRATRFPPGGSRGLSTDRHSSYGLGMSLAERVANQAPPVVVAQLETAEAIARADEIAAVDGCDVVFVGLTDLTVDLGLTGQYDHPEVRRLVDHARAVCERNSVVLGAPAASESMAKELIALGVRYVTFNDFRLLSGAAVTAIGATRGNEPLASAVVGDGDERGRR